MKAVFIDAIVNFKFRLPPHPLSFSALSFHTLNCCIYSIYSIYRTVYIANSYFLILYVKILIQLPLGLNFFLHNMLICELKS